MKITCNVIKDVLPLYVEGLSSSDTNALIEEHLSLCVDCKEELESLRSSNPVFIDTNTTPIKKIQTSFQKQKYNLVLIVVLFMLVICISVVGFLTSPIYIQYPQDAVTIKPIENGLILVHFKENVTDYEISHYQLENSSYMAYTITAWDSTWNRIFNKPTPQDIVLNADERKIARFYFFTAGSDDLLLYGSQSGGCMTLPRLVLGYYVSLAFVIAFILGTFILVFHKKVQTKKVLVTLFFIPISYLMAHLCIKGFTTETYSASRDFFLIVLVALPIFSLFWILYNKIFNKKTNSL